MSTFWQKTVQGAKSVGGAIVDTTKGSVDAVSFAVKHKTLSVSAGKEDEEYAVPMTKFLELRTGLIKVRDEANKFVDSMKCISLNCKDLGVGFSAISNEMDPSGPRRTTEAYNTAMLAVNDTFKGVAQERISSEVIGSINAKIVEMDKIKVKIDNRVNIKREYEYYNNKMKLLKEDPSKAEKDPSKIQRNGEKLTEYTAQLEQTTVELLRTFDVYERARPELLKAEFDALRSAQKEYFTSIANSMTQFATTSPGIPGGGLSVEDIALASGMSACSVTYSLGGERRKSIGGEEGESSMRTPPPPLPPSSGGSSSEICKVKMLYKFDARSSDELTLSVGQIVSVIEKKPDGWYVGTCGGKTGLFPGNYGQEIESAQTPTIPGEYTSMVADAGVKYAKENPDKVKEGLIAVAKNEQARNAVIGFAKSNPDLVKAGAKSAMSSGGGTL